MTIDFDITYTPDNQIDVKALYTHEHERIFGIGFFRTGTKSLNEALRILGFTAGQAPTMMEVVLYQCVTDVIPLFFWKELIDAYPKSKAILTVREPGSWRQSTISTVGRNPVWNRRLDWARDIAFNVFTRKFLGNAGYREDWDQKYLDHNKEVQEYFAANCPERLLVMDICGGDGWEKLCPFLGREIPNVPFPRIK